MAPMLRLEVTVFGEQTAGKKKARTYAAPKPPKEDGGDVRISLNNANQLFNWSIRLGPKPRLPDVCIINK